MSNPYTAEIEAGAAWLDENAPDWLEAFVEDRGAGLHMDDCHRCVLGHVFGSYWHERSPVYRFGAVAPGDLRWGSDNDAILVWDENLEKVMRAAVPLGFTIPTGAPKEEEQDAWDDLGQGWRDLIEKRLAEAGRLA